MLHDCLTSKNTSLWGEKTDILESRTYELLTSSDVCWKTVLIWERTSSMRRGMLSIVSPSVGIAGRQVAITLPAEAISHCTIWFQQDKWYILLLSGSSLWPSFAKRPFFLSREICKIVAIIFWKELLTALYKDQTLFSELNKVPYRLHWKFVWSYTHVKQRTVLWTERCFVYIR